MTIKFNLRFETEEFKNRTLIDILSDFDKQMLISISEVRKQLIADKIKVERER